MDGARAPGFIEEPEAVVIQAAQGEPPTDVVLVFVELNLAEGDKQGEGGEGSEKGNKAGLTPPIGIGDFVSRTAGGTPDGAEPAAANIKSDVVEIPRDSPIGVDDKVLIAFVEQAGESTPGYGFSDGGGEGKQEESKNEVLGEVNELRVIDSQ